MARIARPRPRTGGIASPPASPQRQLPRENLRFETRQIPRDRRQREASPHEPRGHWSRVFELVDQVHQFREHLAWYRQGGLEPYLQSLDPTDRITTAVTIRDWAARPKIVEYNRDRTVLIDWRPVAGRRQWMFQDGTITAYKPAFAEAHFYDMLNDERVPTQYINCVDQMIVSLFMSDITTEGALYYHPCKVAAYRQAIRRR